MLELVNLRDAARAAAFATMVCVVGSVEATVLTQWNFNTALGVNNTPAPSVGAGSATPVGMNGGLNNADIGNATGSSDPDAPNRHWRVRGSQSNGWSGTTQLLSGAQFNASTAGFQDIVVSLDLFATDGSPRHAQFQYTLDGTSFTSFGGILDFNATSDAWANGLNFNLSSIVGANNNPNLGFKIVSAFSPVQFTNANGVQPANSAFQRTSAELQVYNGTAGNYRFDMVTFSGNVIPAPGAAVVVLGGLWIARRRR